MRRIRIVAILLLGVTFSTAAQSMSDNAIGLRLGDNDGFGGEISYQRKLDTNNRLEFDLGWRNSNDVDAIKLVGLYQWVMNIDGGFNWFAGVGAGVGTWKLDNRFNNDNGAYGLVAGDIGIEYDFDIPLMLSLDFRPEIYFNSDDFRESNFGPDIALGVRFQF